MLILTTVTPSYLTSAVLLPNETQQLRRVASQLNWVSTQTRPDKSYAANIISESIKEARVKDLIVANKFIKFLKSRNAIISEKR